MRRRRRRRRQLGLGGEEHELDRRRVRRPLRARVQRRGYRLHQVNVYSMINLQYRVVHLVEDNLLLTLK